MSVPADTPETRAARDALPPLRRALVMLDFDGTLVDLAPVPDAIDVPESLCNLLDRLNRQSAGVTLISGRAVGDLARLIPAYHGDIFGSHGSESRIDGTYRQMARVTDKRLTEIWAGADAIAATAPGRLLAERKPAGVVVHYRQAPELEDMVTAKVAALVQADPDFETHPSKMAAEIRPKGASKAEAARMVIAAADDRVHPFFAGDDTTDEDAMSVVNAAGGTTVKIGQGDSCAAYRLADPTALRDLLNWWAEGA